MLATQSCLSSLFSNVRDPRTLLVRILFYLTRNAAIIIPPFPEPPFFVERLLSVLELWTRLRRLEANLRQAYWVSFPLTQQKPSRVVRGLLTGVFRYCGCSWAIFHWDPPFVRSLLSLWNCDDAIIAPPRGKKNVSYLQTQTRTLIAFAWPQRLAHTFTSQLRHL